MSKLKGLQIQHRISQVGVAKEGAYIGVSFLQIQHSVIIYNNRGIFKRQGATLVHYARALIRYRGYYALCNNLVHAPNKGSLKHLRIHRSVLVMSSLIGQVCLTHGVDISSTDQRQPGSASLSTLQFEITLEL